MCRAIYLDCIDERHDLEVIKEGAKAPPIMSLAQISYRIANYHENIEVPGFNATKVISLEIISDADHHLF